MQATSHMAGTATEVAHFTASANIVGESMEELAIKWFAIELVEQAASILASDPIIVVADGRNAVVRHFFF